MLQLLDCFLYFLVIFPYLQLAHQLDLQKILKQIIFIHSARDGFTFPGIIDEPACTAGIPISDIPATGPDAINLISFASLLISRAKFRSADETVATANLLCKEYCISFSGFTGSFEMFASCVIANFLYPLGAFAPVPTAVPPSATYSNSLLAPTRKFLALVMEVAYAPNSLPKVTGNASIR